MRLGFFIQTYLTIGATFGVILAQPVWRRVLEAGPLPHEWPALKPILLTLLLATGHGVLRAYAWLPSLIYNQYNRLLDFQHWLFAGSW
jgi:hypothetical protein